MVGRKNCARKIVVANSGRTEIVPPAPMGIPKVDHHCAGLVALRFFSYQLAVGWAPELDLENLARDLDFDFTPWSNPALRFDSKVKSGPQIWLQGQILTRDLTPRSNPAARFDSTVKSGRQI